MLFPAYTINFPGYTKFVISGVQKNIIFGYTINFSGYKQYAISREKKKK